MLPEEDELARLNAEQARLQDQVASAELTLRTIKAETAVFQHRYYRKVGRLYAELDALDAELAKLRVRQRPNDAAVHEEARAADHRAKKSAEEVGLSEACPEPRPTMDPGFKEAYRRAVKLLHPDLATTERERQRRTESMVQVNLAYERGDQKAIQQLMEDFGRDPDAIVGEDVASCIVKAIRRIAQLHGRLGELQLEIEADKKAEIFKLRQRVEEAEAIGRNPLGDLAEELMQQITKRRISLKVHQEQLS
jgi:hypothetical protein